MQLSTSMQAIALTALAGIALAGCAATGPSDTSGTGPSQSDSATPSESSATSTAASSSTLTLTTVETEAGTVVVDGDGRVVHQFDNDEQGAGTSACADSCLTSWSIVPGGANVTTEGIAGEVGSFTNGQGDEQATLNGWPLYYFAEDDDAGDAYGQGVNNVWWALDASGTPIH